MPFLDIFNDKVSDKPSTCDFSGTSISPQSESPERYFSCTAALGNLRSPALDQIGMSYDSYKNTLKEKKKKKRSLSEKTKLCVILGQREVRLNNCFTVLTKYPRTGSVEQLF